MSVLSTNFDVNLPIRDQLMYIGFVPQSLDAFAPAHMRDTFQKTVAGITINVKLDYTSISRAVAHRISLDWRDVVVHHLADMLYGPATLEGIDTIVRKPPDGDGCISKNGNDISITCHNSWMRFYNDLFNRLNIHYTAREYHAMSIHLSTKQVRNFLYIFLKQNPLPILKRKWERLTI